VAEVRKKIEERQDRERAHELEKLKIEKNAETERFQLYGKRNW